MFPAKNADATPSTISDDRLEIQDCNNKYHRTSATITHLPMLMMNRGQREFLPGKWLEVFPIRGYRCPSRRNTSDKNIGAVYYPGNPPQYLLPSREWSKSVYFFVPLAKTKAIECHESRGPRRVKLSRSDQRSVRNSPHGQRGVKSWSTRSVSSSTWRTWGKTRQSASASVVSPTVSKSTFEKQRRWTLPNFAPRSPNSFKGPSNGEE